MSRADHYQQGPKQRHGQHGTASGTQAEHRPPMPELRHAVTAKAAAATAQNATHTNQIHTTIATSRPITSAAA